MNYFSYKNFYTYLKNIRSIISDFGFYASYIFALARELRF